MKKLILVLILLMAMCAVTWGKGNVKITSDMMYITTDGKKFSDCDKATEHQKKIAPLEAWIKMHLDNKRDKCSDYHPCIYSLNGNELMDIMINDSEELLKILEKVTGMKPCKETTLTFTIVD